MKIKHFAGYGCVIATKKKEVKVTQDVKRVIIKVTGNHERGLYRNDRYDVYRWLMSRLCKDCKSYTNICRVDIVETYEKINNLDTEVCTYTIDYIL